MSGRDGGGCFTAVAVVLGIAVVALGAALLYLVLAGDVSSSRQGEPQRQELVAKAFSEYTWDELAQVADLIGSAETDDAAREVATSYNLSVGDVRPLPLDNGITAQLTIVGIYHDERTDGAGKAGLTLMTSPIALRAMSSSGTNAGGWESSELRAWLAGEGADLLPDELASAIVPVSKLTNNVGVTADVASVTQTSDALWLFSASEVCGQVSWFTDEYGTEPNAHTGYVDFKRYDALLSAEGEQYEYFSGAGVTATSDPGNVLALPYGGSTVAWWYRTAYPYSFTGEDASYFYQVMASGYPGTTGLASEPAGIVVGLCL
ncbi:MAG TPA: hypothetical protein IAA15_03225 [Candidatus Olsenella pullicola]|nr:hypothetical protein [Candidatus Olsenella pullicola]